MSYKLFLDDERDPYKVSWVKLPLGPWVIVRNYQEFVAAIEEKGLPEHVSFDHDLADEHYDSATWNWGPEGTGYKEKTGYHCAYFLFTHCLEKDLDLPAFTVHSKNPVGRQRINDLLKSYESTRETYKEA